MKLFYELYNPPLTSKKPKPSKSSHPSGNIASYESGYSSAVLDIEPSNMSNTPSDVWAVDSGASNYMIPLNRPCFIDYSTDLPGPNIIKGINGDTKVLGIGTLTLTTPNGGELVLREVLHASGLPYSLLSLGRLMMADNTILFSDPYCIIENSTGFRIKSKLRYGTPMSATSQPPVFLLSPKLRSYQKASKQLFLGPFQILASASLILKANRHDYRILRQRGDPYLCWSSFTQTPATYLFPPSKDTKTSSSLQTKPPICRSYFISSIRNLLLSSKYLRSSRNALNCIFTRKDLR